jgi:dihydrofolate reductase
MRKIVMWNLVSADGYFAAPDGGFDWFVWDADLDRFAAETIRRFDTVLLGRVTYEAFAAYWPKAAKDPNTKPDDLIIADKLDEMTKIVFSKSLDGARWKNSEIRGDLVPGEVEALKRQAGADIVIYGSGSIVDQLTQARLIDEYEFLVNPVILGGGKQLVANATAGTVRLDLVETRPFRTGNVLLRYTLAG